MIKKKKLILVLSILTLIILLTIFVYSNFIYKNVMLDSISHFYPAKVLLEKNNLNMWNQLNNEYGTYYFKFPFTDEVIYSAGKSFPTQLIFPIFLTALIISFFGYSSFFYINLGCALIILLFSFLIFKSILVNKTISFVGLLILFSFPLFMFWSIFPQTIMFLFLFFIISFYFLLKYFENKVIIYIFLSSLFLGFAILIKPIIILAIFPYYLLFVLSQKKFISRELIYFLIPILFIITSLILFNFIYFENPFFIGYLKTDYHPISLTNNYSLFPEITNKFFFQGFSIEGLKNNFYYFAKGILTYSPLLFILVLLFPILFFIKKDKKTLLFILMFFLIFLVYYSTLEGSLWKPTNDTEIYSLALAFFRYHLVTFFILLILGLLILCKPYLSLNNQYMKIIILAMVVILLILNINYAINYTGGASLSWYSEFSENVINYSVKINPILEKDSIILIPERWEIAFLYPYTNNYNFFYYDGIPPNYRIKETKRVINELLNDDRKIYIGLYGEPSLSSTLSKNEGDPNIKEVIASIEKEFTIVPMEETYFKRMNFKFGEIVKK